MATDMELTQAKRAYRKFCEMLDDQNWKYNKDDEKLSITTGASGEDLPIDIRVNVDQGKQLVTLLSQLPYSVPEESRVLMAVAVTAANYSMVDGSFDYNLANGKIIFRMTTSIRGSLVGKDVYEYMLYVSCKTVDMYNDKFLMVMKNQMPLEDFINFAKE